MRDGPFDITNPRAARRPRRGNAMILVAGILVLLVIIAAAYVTRTQGGRMTAVAVQHSQTRDANARVIAEMLASEPAAALFPWPVNTSLTIEEQEDSNTPRLSPLVTDAAPFVEVYRYGVDSGFPINFAPYHVVPVTNWPDDYDLVSLGLDDSEANQPGNAGFSDTRWLRDVEPVRWDLDNDGLYDSFRHWRHMTNIARPNNGWRIVGNLADVEAMLVTDLGAPVEQWPVSRQPDPSLHSVLTGDAIWDARSSALWNGWLLANKAVLEAYPGPSLIPPNFYNLKDLDGDGVLLEAGEHPQDEFIRGTARWDVSRVLADADGDGFTDSFWFLVPNPIERGIRQVVAVSIVDNSALFNANVATNFWPGGQDWGRSVLDRDGTAGETPADLAASGQQIFWDAAASSIPPASWNVGFFDAFANWEGGLDYPAWYTGDFPLYYNTDSDPLQIEWSAARWYELFSELGVVDNRADLFGCSRPSGEICGPSVVWPDGVIRSARERRLYWLNGGRRPLAATGGLTPFALADEVELRLFHGQNHPWILSRFERAVNTQDTFNAFLRSGFAYEETTPYRRQLANTELLHDNRRKVTLFSGARNDETPPWLWWRYGNDPDSVPDFVRTDWGTDPGAIDNWMAQNRRKLDLREPNWLDVDPDPGAGEGFLHQRLPWTILHALSDGDHLGGVTYSDEFDDYNDLRKIAASYAANILAYRDIDDDAPLVDDDSAGQIGAIPLPNSEEIVTAHGDGRLTRYLGMERQPFLAEAFIAHVYASAGTVPEGPDGPIFGSTENYVVRAPDPPPDDPKQTTIVVVQIMSPFRRTDPADPTNHCYEPIDLSNYSLVVAGEPFDLDGRLLCQATEENPASAIFYSIEDGFDGDPLFEDKWLEFLDLKPTDLAPGTIVVKVPGEAWSYDRHHYDSVFDGQHAIELLRDIVVVDRFDQPATGGAGGGGGKFGDQLSDALDDLFDVSRPPLAGDSFLDDPPPPEHWFNGIRIGSNTHWVTWGRVFRGYGNDFDFQLGNRPTHGIQPHERAPRFVFAQQYVTRPDDSQDGQDGGPGTVTYEGNEFRIDATPDTPWFDREHPGENWKTMLGAFPRRKPTFFTMNVVYDPSGNDRYDPFDHATYGYGRYFYTPVPVPPGTPLPGAGVPDKGEPSLDDVGVFETPYSLAEEPSYFEHSLQMLQKDDDFQQVGELFNVWLYGHELAFLPGDVYSGTKRTFSEAMAASVRLAENEVKDAEFAGMEWRVLWELRKRHINRLQAGETVAAGVAPYPALPAGLRMLDAVVCDGPGQLRDFNDDGFVGDVDDRDIWEEYRFANAGGFTGAATPGLININTAPVEVLRTLPHWYKLVHDDPTFVFPDRFPRTAIAEAAIAYREQYGDWFSPAGTFQNIFAPNYAGRNITIEEPGIEDALLRRDRGFASIGELSLLHKEGKPFWEPLGERVDVDAWRIDFAGRAEVLPLERKSPFNRNPGVDGPPTARMSTDVVGDHEDWQGPGAAAPYTMYGGDGVAEDAEEANLLFAGVSNLVTTRSDVFTVYFKVRNFRQNPSGLGGPVWDATDPNFIVDESRYVMLIDRSEVDKPSDRPKILYLEKVPN